MHNSVETSRLGRCGISFAVTWSHVLQANVTHFEARRKNLLDKFDPAPKASNCFWEGSKGPQPLWKSCGCFLRHPKGLLRLPEVPEGSQQSHQRASEVSGEIPGPSEAFKGLSQGLQKPSSAFGIATKTSRGTPKGFRGFGMRPKAPNGVARGLRRLQN